MFHVLARSSKLWPFFDNSDIKTDQECTDLILDGKRPQLPREFLEKHGSFEYSGLLIDLMNRCWSEDPNERPASFADIFELLVQYILMVFVAEETD